MKVFRKIILILLTIVVMFLLYITISFAYQKIVLKKVPYVFGYTSFINTGSSMLPYINVGDLVIVKKEDSYKVNDVISFKTNENFVNTHRVISIKSGYYKTKGDSNKFNDGEEIDKSRVFGKVVLVISNFGVIYAFLLNNYLYIFIGIIVLSLLVFLIHIWRKNEGRRNNWISS